MELILNNTSVSIEPYRIVNFDGIWYLFGKELEAEKVKTFFIHQIQKIKILKEKYILEKPIHEILDNVHSAWFEDGNQFEVEVKVNSCVAFNFKLKEVLPSQEIIEEYENGDLLIKFKVSTEEDVDNIIKALYS